jgi:hypothetical protein
MSVASLGTDFRWTTEETPTGDIDDEWSIEEDPRGAYSQNLFRLCTCAGLWYAPGKTIDVRDYLNDIARDVTCQMEVQQVIDRDERTTRSSVLVTRPRGQDSRDISVEAWDKRGQVHKLTIEIANLDGATVMGLR